MSDCKSLKDKQIGDHYEEYRNAIEFMSGQKQKKEILAVIQKNCDNSTGMLSLLHLYCQKLDADDWELFMTVIDLIKNIEDDEGGWIVKIVFLALETLKKLGGKHKSKIYAVLSRSRNVENHFILLLSGVDNVDTCLEIFQAMETEQASLFKCLMAEISTENNVLQKNIASFLVEIANKRAELFLNFDFLDLMDSELFVFRSCCLEILFNLIFVYKNEGNIEGINEFTETLLDRLLDVNHFVRAKAIQVLTSLVEQQAVTLKLKNKVIENVVLRIEDKAVIVRKKALNFCTMIIKNHPFVANRYLRVERKVNEELLSENEKMYVQDLKIFVAQMKKVIWLVQDIFGCLKTEIGDIVEFMKLAVFYKLDGSLELVTFLCETVEAKQRMLVLQAFIDLLNSLKAEDDVLELLDHITPNFLKVMNKKKIIERETVKALLLKFKNGIDVVRTTRLLKNMCYKRYEDNILEKAAEMLLSDEIKEEYVSSYKNVLNTVSIRPSTADVKCGISNLVLTKVVDFEMIDATVRMLYKMPDPEPLCQLLLEKLCTENKNLAKIIYTVGAVAINESFFIDKLEKKVPKIHVPKEIREKRKSFNVTRTSFRQSINFSMHEKDLSSSFDMSVHQSQDIIDGQVGLKDKTSDEIADILFYIKEREILYGSGSILAPFIKIVVENCKTEDLNVVAYTSMYRMMAVSSEFFLGHFSYFISGLKSTNTLVRYNSLVAMADFILLYNSYVEKYSYLLFDKLFDESENVVKLALFIIYHLVSSKILKIKGYGAVLCRLYRTQHGDIVKSLLISLSSDENTVASIFYEVMMGENEGDMEIIQFIKGLVKDKTKENLFLKILQRFKKEERMGDVFLGQLYGNLSFGVKSVCDMRMNEVFNMWVAGKN
ncbi:hypothetical protein VCUG_01771 [Vavraia culicis subsp. floridensis]|uniref:Condensin complex subunit 1 C-terminal domain-containing protein n=1 Tax=Vavraia culicis (isolate floridensis) TaxID=948595 RepID=L2GUG2_VAVCU|nr:uncharacterized protein VCUG_01771 [Vavraia culicis subsp. floridensis]ELA46745.1 hypothetical protein VCUG_01771 [Vavraia culicis subsp. floridensis]